MVLLRVVQVLPAFQAFAHGHNLGFRTALRPRGHDRRLRGGGQAQAQLPPLAVLVHPRGIAFPHTGGDVVASVTEAAALQGPDLLAVLARATRVHRSHYTLFLSEPWDCTPSAMQDGPA